MYFLEGNYVYQKYTTPRGTEVTEYHCPKTACNLIQETDTQLIYAWQNFNVSTGAYETDQANNTPVTINGTTYTPVNGQVVVQKA